MSTLIWYYLRTAQQEFLKAHEHAFDRFGGVFHLLRYDNLAGAVYKILRDYQRRRRFGSWLFRSHWRFAFITRTWRGQPLVSHTVVFQLIGATTSETGLQVTSEIDADLHSEGVQAINLTQAAIPRVMDLYHYP